MTPQNEPQWYSLQSLKDEMLYDLIGKEKNHLEAFKVLLKDQEEWANKNGNF